MVIDDVDVVGHNNNSTLTLVEGMGSGLAMECVQENHYYFMVTDVLRFRIS